MMGDSAQLLATFGGSRRGTWRLGDRRHHKNLPHVAGRTIAAIGVHVIGVDADTLREIVRVTDAVRPRVRCQNTGTLTQSFLNFQQRTVIALRRNVLVLVNRGIVLTLRRILRLSILRWLVFDVVEQTV